MTKMKKILAIGLAGVLAVGFAACSGAKDDAKKDADKKADTAVVEQADAVKTGYAVSASLGHISHDESNTAIEIDTLVAAVLVDKDGKVVACQIDEAQTQPKIEENCEVTGDMLKTKKQKEELYGMKGVSPIGAEWFEQIAAFEAWCVGKTADEIADANVTEGGAIADLESSCTIYSMGFAGVVLDAINNATDCGAKADDTLKLVLKTEKYYEATPELPQYDTDIAVVTTDKDGKITSCIIDAAQGKCPVADGEFKNADGAYPEGEFKSKKQLKEEYGMKGVSASIGAIENGGEWYEQAAAYEAWAIGKTADEIKAGMGADGKVADLASSCTITTFSITETVAAAATK